MASGNIPAESMPASEIELETFQKIVSLSNAFKRTHVLKSAVELGIFPATHGGPHTADEVARKCGVHESQHLNVLLDVLVNEGFLERSKVADGDGKSVTKYQNSKGTDIMLGDESAPTHVTAVKTMLEETEAEMKKWSKLTEVLKTGVAKPPSATDAEQDQVRCDCHDAEGEEEVTPEVLAEWERLYIMCEGYMRLSFNVLTEKFDFSRYKSVVDIGGGSAQLSRILCRRFKHLRCVNFDLPRTVSIAEKRMAELGSDVADRVQLVGGDCFKEDLPTPVDVVTMANVIHGFESDELRQQVVKKVFDALSPGGALIIIEDILDVDKHSESAQFWQLTMDVTLAWDAGAKEGAKHSNYYMITFDTFQRWCDAAGFQFSRADSFELMGSMVAAVAYKPATGQ